MATATYVRNHPPGPKGLPVVGNLFAYSRDPLGFLSRCSREYGDVVRLGFPGPPAYLISHPDGVEHVLVKNNKNFVRDRYTRAELAILGDGLLVNEGDSWRRQRRLAQPAFHRRRVEAFGETMVSFTERMLDGWQDGDILDVHAEMMRLTLEIVAKTLFDTDISREAEGVGRSMEAIMARSSDQGSSVFLRMLPDSVPTPGNLAYRRATRRLDGIIDALVEERRRSGADAGDLLSMLLHAEDEDGRGMSDRQLRDEAMTIILAGHETTAIALSWTWHLLGTHPEVEARLLAELEEVLGGRAPTVEDMPRLRYADAVIKESMRLYPPAWAVGREAVGDCEIGGYHVPPGRSCSSASTWFSATDASSTTPGPSTRSAGPTGARRICPRTPTSRSGAGRGCASAAASRRWKPCCCWRRWRRGSGWSRSPGGTRWRNPRSRCARGTV